MRKRFIRRILQDSPLHSLHTTRRKSSALETGNNGHNGGNGKLGKCEETIEERKDLFQIDPTVSIYAAFSGLQLPPTVLHRISRMCLFLLPFKLQTLQTLNDADKQNSLNLLNIAFYGLRVAQTTNQNLFLSMNACFV